MGQQPQILRLGLRNITHVPEEEMLKEMANGTVGNTIQFTLKKRKRNGMINGIENGQEKMKINYDDLRLESYKIDDKSWYYEDKKGIEIIYHEEDGKYIHITIPWYKLKRSLSRAYGFEVVTDA